MGATPTLGGLERLLRTYLAIGLATAAKGTLLMPCFRSSVEQDTANALHAALEADFAAARAGGTLDRFLAKHTCKGGDPSVAVSGIFDLLWEFHPQVYAAFDYYAALGVSDFTRISFKS